MLPLQPPLQRWVRGTTYHQKEEHRGNHHQIEGFGGRAEPVGSAESQGEACGFEPWGAVCTFPIDLGPRTKWLPQCEPCEWLRVCAYVHPVFVTWQEPNSSVVCQVAPGPSCRRWSEIVCLYVDSWRFKLMVQVSVSLIAVLSFFHLNQRKHLANTT